MPSGQTRARLRGLERLADGLDPHRGAELPDGLCMSDSLPVPEPEDR